MVHVLCGLGQVTQSLRCPGCRRTGGGASAHASPCLPSLGFDAVSAETFLARNVGLLSAQRQRNSPSGDMVHDASGFKPFFYQSALSSIPSSNTGRTGMIFI